MTQENVHSDTTELSGYLMQPARDLMIITAVESLATERLRAYSSGEIIEISDSNDEVDIDAHRHTSPKRANSSTSQRVISPGSKSSQLAANIQLNIILNNEVSKSSRKCFQQTAAGCHDVSKQSRNLANSNDVASVASSDFVDLEQSHNRSAERLTRKRNRHQPRPETNQRHHFVHDVDVFTDSAAAVNGNQIKASRSGRYLLRKRGRYFPDRSTGSRSPSTSSICSASSSTSSVSSSALTAARPKSQLQNLPADCCTQSVRTLSVDQVRTDMIRASLANNFKTRLSADTEENSDLDPNSAARIANDREKASNSATPSATLTKADFDKLTLDAVNDLIARYGCGIVEKISLDDIVRKGLSEIQPPKNIKVTPRLNPKLQFKSPILPDDEVIVISDSEVEEESGSNVNAAPVSVKLYKAEATEPPPRAQEDFLANLQLFHDFKLKKPLKKDVASVLKTRNNIKAYVANPFVSILKADCIYKYVISKGILRPGQLRANPDTNRKAKRSKFDVWRTSRQTSAKRKRKPLQSAVRASGPTENSGRNSTPLKFQQTISKFEKMGVWSSYSQVSVTSRLKVPVVVLHKIDPHNWRNDAEVKQRRRRAVGRPKETKCKWCPFHCLNVPSLKVHCLEVHAK